MTEETEGRTEIEEVKSPDEKKNGSDEDPRFEVKWRKKETSTAPQPVAETSPPADDPAALRRQLEEAQEQISNLRDRWQRSAADLANLRRHTEQQRGEMEQFASMLLVMDLLPVLDNFGRAIQTLAYA